MARFEARPSEWGAPRTVRRVNRLEIGVPDAELALPAKRITSVELGMLLDTVGSGAAALLVRARWRDGRRVATTDIAELERRQRISILELNAVARYPDGSALELEFTSRECYLGVRGATATDRARLAAQRYEWFPTRRFGGLLGHGEVLPMLRWHHARPEVAALLVVLITVVLAAGLIAILMIVSQDPP